MNSRNTAIGRQFNRSAAVSYDRHANVQRIMVNELTKSLMDRMSKTDTNRSMGDTKRPKILEIGCGTGNLTEILINEFPGSSITALDIAPAMIQAAEQRVRASAENNLQYSDKQPSRVHFLQADVELWAANATASSFDLIVSSACFQWLSHPKQTLGYLRCLLRTGGLLAFATFGPDTFRELHLAFDEVYRAGGLESQRHGLSFQSADHWNELLRETEFTSIENERMFQTEEFASARDFLLSVKALGASTSDATISRGIGARSLFTNMYKEYENKFSTPGGVAATYDVLLIQALAT